MSLRNSRLAPLARHIPASGHHAASATIFASIIYRRATTYASGFHHTCARACRPLSVASPVSRLFTCRVVTCFLLPGWRQTTMNAFFVPVIKRFAYFVFAGNVCVRLRPCSAPTVTTAGAHSSRFSTIPYDDVALFYTIGGNSIDSICWANSRPSCCRSRWFCETPHERASALTGVPNNFKHVFAQRNDVSSSIGVFPDTDLLSNNNVWVFSTSRRRATTLGLRSWREPYSRTSYSLLARDNSILLSPFICLDAGGVVCTGAVLFYLCGAACWPTRWRLSSNGRGVERLLCAAAWCCNEHLN